MKFEEKEKLNAKTLFDSGIYALFVWLTSETENYEHTTIFTVRKIPLLFFDRVIDLPKFLTILIDKEGTGFETTEHLVQQECNQIVHIAGNPKRNVYSERFRWVPKNT